MAKLIEAGTSQGLRFERQKVVENFFRENPELKSRSKLIGAILPWVVSQSTSLLPREALNQSKRKALSLYRGDGMTGDWYGVFSQNSTLENGETVSFNQFFRATLLQDGNKITGTGEIGTGEQLEISGTIAAGQFEGVVANTTSAINSRFSGIVADEQVAHLALIEEVEHKTAGKMKFVGGPVTFSGPGEKEETAPPLVGEHTRKVLQELGYSESAITTLAAQRLIQIYDEGARS